MSTTYVVAMCPAHEKLKYLTGLAKHRCLADVLGAHALVLAFLRCNNFGTRGLEIPAPVSDYAKKPRSSSF